LSYAFISACGLAEKTPEENVKLAFEAQARGDYKSAIILFKTAISGDKNDGLARRAIADLYIKLGDGASAEKEYREYLKSGAPVFPDFLRALLLQGKLDEVLAVTLPKQLPAGERADMLSAKSIASSRLGKFKDAQRFLEQAQDLVETDYVQLAEAILAFSGGQYTASRDVLEVLLREHTDNQFAWELLGDVTAAQSDLEAADQAFSQAIDSGVFITAVLMKRALTRVGLNRLAAAGEDVTRLQDSGTDHYVVNYIKGLIEFKQANYTLALQEFEWALKTFPNYAPALFYQGATHYLLGHVSRAEESLESFQSLSPGSLLGSELMAAIKFNLKDYAESEELVRHVVDHDQLNAGALGLLARVKLAQGDLAGGVQNLARVKALLPDSADASADLGGSLIDAGDTRSGVKQLLQAIELDPQHDGASIKLVFTYLQSGELDSALKSAQDYVARKPNSVSPYIVQGYIHLQRSEHDEASASYQKALQLNPGNASANSGLAAISLSRKDLEGARHFYLNTLYFYPDDEATLINIATLEATTDNKASAETYLLHALEVNSALNTRLLLSKLYLDRGNPGGVVNLLAEGTRLNSNNLVALDLLGKAYFQLGELTEARRLLEKIIKLSPDNAQAFYTLGRIDLMETKRRAARGMFEKVLALDSSHYAAIKVLLKLSLMDNDLEAAEGYLNLITPPGDKDLELTRLQAKYFEANGDKVSAINLYEKILLDERNNFNLIRLTRLLLKVDRQQEAIKHLVHWLDSFEGDRLVMLELAEIYGAQGQPDLAQPLYESILQRDPDDVIALNNLAWMLHVEDPARASLYAERAVAMEPNSAEAKDTYAMALLNTGDIESAKRVIDKAKLIDSSSPSISYHRALIMKESGDYKAAEEELLLTLKSETPSAYRKDALALLESLSRGQ